MEKKPSLGEYGLNDVKHEDDLVFDDLEFDSVDLPEKNEEQGHEDEVGKRSRVDGGGTEIKPQEQVMPVSEVEVVEESGGPKSWEDGVKYVTRLASDREIATNPYELQKLVSELRRALSRLNGEYGGEVK